MGMSIMIITHDLGVIEMADLVLVMYTEVGRVPVLMRSSMNRCTPIHKGLPSIPELVERAIEPKVRYPVCLTCRATYFAPRCPKAMDICHRQQPPTIQVSPEHSVGCWLYK